jgi:hypothetical protein
VHGRTERSRTRTVESAAIRVEASRDDAERLALMLPGSEAIRALLLVNGAMIETGNFSTPIP